MSTRSVIATAHGDTWKGRYCHSDGYPSWNGRILWNAIAHHPEGVCAALNALEAFLSDDGPGSWGISFIEDPSFLADTRLASWEDRDSDGNVRVYKGRPGEHEPDTPWWYEPGSEMEEYLYVATKGGLMVFDTPYKGEPILLGLFRFDDEEPNWDELKADEA